MSMFSGPTEHAANPPETWKVVKINDRSWALTSKDGHSFATFPRKMDADMARTLPESFWRSMYDRETQWYLGKHVAGWKPWAEVKAEHERTMRRLAERGRTGLAERVDRLTERLRNEHRAVSSDPVPVDVIAWARWYATTYPSPTSATLSELADQVDGARAEIARMDGVLADLVAA